VLGAQANLRQAKRAYAHSRDDYALSVLRLQGAAGGSTPEELEETNPWFE
jgi:outer membrane protein TolC